jgi:hypothetical protein
MIMLIKGSLIAHASHYLTVYLPTHRKVNPNTVKAYKKSLNLIPDCVLLAVLLFPRSSNSPYYKATLLQSISKR